MSAAAQKEDKNIREILSLKSWKKKLEGEDW